MNVSIVYICPGVHTAVYEPLAQRFARSYLEHPPGETEHSLNVVVNGNVPGPRHRQLFDPLPATFLSHSNMGKDLGGYVMAAEKIPCDLLICMGSHVHFRRAGWLDRIVNVYLDNGPGIYGPWAFHQPAPHIRTTAFFITPTLLNAYPYTIIDSNRYQVEHGKGNSLTAWVGSMGFPTLQVTWDGVYAEKDWHHVPNEQCLFLEQFCDKMGYT